MDERISAYAGMCSSLAEKLARAGRRHGAEYDDLYQEGLISVWQALERGVTPSSEIVEYRMRSWIRYISRQTPVPYEALLPLDDYPGGASQL